MRACGVGQRILVRVALILLYSPLAWLFTMRGFLSWAIQKQAAIVEDAKANPTMGALDFRSIYVHKQQ